MTFMLPVGQMAPEVRPGIEMAVRAPAPATPFISFYAPAQIMAMAREAGSAMSGTSRPPYSQQRYFRANGWLELVERRRIPDCGHVAGESCPYGRSCGCFPATKPRAIRRGKRLAR